ncbi:MAG: HD-GYP domain-containing protein [Clostridia bacterium]|nr:HD-GYP domain-containing protein [Clostridia bacterium]
MRKNQIHTEDGYKILVVDDEEGIIESISIFLKRSGYNVTGITNPLEAIELIRNNNFDLLILDYIMAPIHGDKVIEEVRKFNQDLYILLLTGHKDLIPPLETIKKYDIQGYCEKSDNPNQLLVLIESALKSVEQVKTIRKINIELEQSKDKLADAYMGTVEALRIAVDAKDTYTKGHSDRVAFYSKLIAKEIGISEEEQERIYIGGLFHDIGKIGVPDAILQKQDKLTDDEYSEIKNHTLIGAQIINAATIFEDIIPIVKYHHERFDGKGYPGKLIGEEIPLYARIVTIADAFDAMTSDRQYRKGLLIDVAKDELIKNAGTQFDGNLARKFVEIIERERNVIENAIKNMAK